MDLRTIARATDGIVQGRQVLAPGPGHGRADRSLSIRLSAQSPTGFICFSHAGDDFRVARDYVAQRLGLGPDAWKRRQEETVDNIHGSSPVRLEVKHDNVMNDQSDNAARIARARAIWAAAEPATGTVVETYLTGRGLRLDLLYNVHEVVRFHPHTPWRDEEADRTVYVPCMIAPLRSIEADEVTGIHRTRLGPDGAKLGRRMLGLASGTAVKLDADDTVTMGLTIGEGIETCLAARQLGFVPCWALGSAGAIERFPVLGGIECLSILAESDKTNARAVEACAARWHEAGREVMIVEPLTGSDLNDAMRGVG